MEIAKGVTTSQYLALDLSDFTSDNWVIAANYLDKRLMDRYIEPADLLIDSEKSKLAKDKKFGFTILAIDCLLCETIQSFYEGVENSHGHSAEIFSRFLMQRNKFATFFDTQIKATRFYIDFRCGILHQAQTQGKTKIHAIGPLLSIKDGYTVINRIAFHNAIIKEKDDYIQAIKARTNIPLLRLFKKKMDYIAST